MYFTKMDVQEKEYSALEVSFRRYRGKSGVVQEMFIGTKWFSVIYKWTKLPDLIELSVSVERQKPTEHM